jgi:hypothetical protein
MMLRCIWKADRSNASRNALARHFSGTLAHLMRHVAQDSPLGRKGADDVENMHGAQVFMQFVTSSPDVLHSS